MLAVFYSILLRRGILLAGQPLHVSLIPFMGNSICAHCIPKLTRATLKLIDAEKRND
jgi:hypothetical protein